MNKAVKFMIPTSVIIWELGIQATQIKYQTEEKKLRLKKLRGDSVYRFGVPMKPEQIITMADDLRDSRENLDRFSLINRSKTCRE